MRQVLNPLLLGADESILKCNLVGTQTIHTVKSVLTVGAVPSPFTFRTLWSLWSCHTLGASFARIALVTFRTLWSHWSLWTFVTLWTLFALE